MADTDHTFTEIARAKVNLTLHVQAVNGAGYHPLQSLVMFADIGDDLSLQKSETTGLSIKGPFSDGLSQEADNLILKAAQVCMPENGADFQLTKNLPIASGIGGGSADAAAAVRLLDRAYGISSSVPLQALGADFSVCFLSQTCWMEGIGHHLTPLPTRGQLAVLLVNPGVPVSTGIVFELFDENTQSTPFLDKDADMSLLDIVRNGRNDLQSVAIQIAPVIQIVLDEIGAQKGCKIARMSGSGATCFGIFETLLDAQEAAKRIKHIHPEWWSAATLLGEAA